MRQSLQSSQQDNKNPTHTHKSTYSLPVGAGGASLTSLAHHAASSYLGTFFRVAGSLHKRIITIGGTTSCSVDSMLVNPVQASATHQYATFVRDAHSGALVLLQSFAVVEHATTNLLAPRGNIVSIVGNPFLSLKISPLRSIRMSLLLWTQLWQHQKACSL